ncbi:MAG: TlpA family protein disulfide reductase [Polyangiales bacterium]
MTAAQPKARARSRRAELYAALIVAAVGAPLVFVYARAMAEGETRRREAPLRAILGDESFERLARGERTEEHYLGDRLLAPDFTLQDRDGKPWRLRDHRGKVVVINFWTVTCQPCVEELPSVIELADIAQHRPEIEVVAVTTDENWGAVAALFPPHFALKVLFDPERKVVRDKFGTRLFPETWVIDARGVIRLRVDGRRNWSEALSIDAIESFL